jgi:hypothetical protein
VRLAESAGREQACRVSRLLVNGERYDGLASPALLEYEYEAIILDRSAVIFPGFIVVPFKRTVRFEGEPRRADLALIDPQYRAWWIGEVELAHHSFENHVLPQVIVLARASYSQTEAAWLAEQNTELDEDALCDMMRGAQPSVVVIVNAPRPEWKGALEQHGALLIVVEVFRSRRNRLILRQNGDEVPEFGDLVSRCRIDPIMPRLLVLEAPAAIPTSEEAIAIEFGGGMTEWRVIRSADRAWLSPVRGNPFPSDVRSFDLVRAADGRLAFRTSRNR